MKTTYQILVGNIGFVFHTNDYARALETFRCYVAMSNLNCGRASGESVTLLYRDEPLKEFIGRLDFVRNF